MLFASAVAAGGAATLAYLYSGKGLDQSAVGTLIAAGYAGADFLGGMISNSSTASMDEPPKTVVAQPKGDPSSPQIGEDGAAMASNSNLAALGLAGCNVA